MGLGVWGVKNENAHPQLAFANEGDGVALACIVLVLLECT